MSLRRVLVPLCVLAIVFALTPALGWAQRPGGPPAPAAGQCQEDCGTYGVSVAGPATVQRPVNSGPHTADFEAGNTGTLWDSYSATCSSTGGVTCGTVTPSSFSLNPAEAQNVAVTYSVGATSGTLRLTVTGAASGSYTTTITAIPPPTVTMVAPVLTSGSRSVVRNRQPLIRVFYKPAATGASNLVDSTSILFKWRGEDVSTRARLSRGLLEWEVDSTRWLGIGDSAQAYIKVCSVGAACAEVSRWVVLPNDQKPVVGFSGMPLELTGSGFSSSFGPGVSLSGVEIGTGIMTVPYVSMGSPRSTGLVYSTRQSYPRALVQADVELPWPAGTPDQLKVILKDGVTGLDSLTVASPSCVTGSLKRCRAALQGDFSGSSFSTPTRKWLTVEVRVTSGSTTQISVDSVEVVLVDRRTTVYGSGWWPSAGLKLVAAGSDRLLVGPTGTATIYRGHGDSVYIAPPGSFSTLTKTASGWELGARGTTAKAVFDANGRLVRTLDANGNRDSVTYSGSTDQITSVIDPIGKTITLSYSGNGKFSHFTSLTGGAARETRVTIDAGTNQLVRDSASSATAKPYTSQYAYQTYSGTGTLLLTKRIGVIADTTIVTYDAHRRPVTSALPLVQNELGASVKPVITYAAAELRAKGALRPLDSIYVEVRDPRDNWTRSLVTRWGQSWKSWDALGLLTRAHYDSEGFLLWSEGKIADSTRTYHTYDALRRLVRTYAVRAVGDTLRLDSLVYDANHRVIKRIDARGQADSVGYDANGNLIYSRDANNAITRFWYRSTGQLDSVRLPGATVSRVTQYDATWKNPWRQLDEAGVLITESAFDGLGRTTSRWGRVRVQESGTTTSYQWRRSLTYYNVANQVDSTIVQRTNNCTTCAYAPPTWPSTSDTVLTQRSAGIRDRAGRDSVATANGTTVAVTLYDRLGRVVSSRRGALSAPADSTVYDVAGNPKKVITRRGHVITANFDSRNRDTLAVIPTVGTLRKRFTGPSDQLTRLWYDSPVDSIGGVNGERRWGYDSHGRLTADTFYVGSSVKARSYAYDAYERDSVVTGAYGTWTTRYEPVLGLPSKQITPHGDSLVIFFDGRGRLEQLTIQSAGPAQTQTMAYGPTGKLAELLHDVASWSFDAGRYDLDGVDEEEPGPPLGPTWTQKHFTLSKVDSLKEVVAYDGLERLTHWELWSLNAGGALLDSASYAFDRQGNVLTGAGAESYQAGTNRLLSRVEDGYTFTYTFDAAGNTVGAVKTDGTVTVTWDYGYDALNRLVSARRNGTLIARYAYDVLGRRIVKRVYSGVSHGTVAYTRFIYRGEHVLAEADSAGATGWQYTYGPGTDYLVGARDPSGTQYYVVRDKLGSVRRLIRRDGTVQMDARYTPYGVPTLAAGTDPGLRYGWTGREYDAELGWYFHRARHYDPAAKRFMQEDPIGYAGGLNLFAYVGGAVLEARDPNGLLKDYEMWVGGWDSNCYVDFCINADGTIGVNGGSWGERASGALQAWALAMEDRHNTWVAYKSLRCRGKDCVRFEGTGAVNARDECLANQVCRIEYDKLNTGEWIVIVTSSHRDRRCGTGCPALTHAMGWGFLVHINPSQWDSWGRSHDLLMTGAFVLAHEFAHVGLAVLLYNGWRPHIYQPQWDQLTNSYALYVENLARSLVDGGGFRATHE